VNALFVPPKNREVERALREYGYVLKNQWGSHRHYEHPGIGTKITIVGEPGDEMSKGTLYSLLKRAGIPKKRGW
jgi:predicted RNA binding protein YcfA (HicA-like mRNA interferase family)